MPLLRSTKGHTLTLPPRRVSVGESAVNEIPVAPGHGLAAVHFHLQPWESGHFLEDAGSGLNTLVNGQPVSWAPLKHGDVITAGDLRMTYETEGIVPVPNVPAGEPAADTPAFPDAPPVAEPPVPPSWLPPAALLPPAAPGSWRPQSPSASRSGRRWKILLIVALLLALTAAAIWRYVSG